MEQHPRIAEILGVRDALRANLNSLRQVVASAAQLVPPDGNTVANLTHDVIEGVGSLRQLVERLAADSGLPVAVEGLEIDGTLFAEMVESSASALEGREISRWWQGLASALRAGRIEPRLRRSLVRANELRELAANEADASRDRGARVPEGPSQHAAGDDWIIWALSLGSELDDLLAGLDGQSCTSLAEFLCECRDAKWVAGTIAPDLETSRSAPAEPTLPETAAAGTSDSTNLAPEQVEVEIAAELAEAAGAEPVPEHPQDSSFATGAGQDPPKVAEKPVLGAAQEAPSVPVRRAVMQSTRPRPKMGRLGLIAAARAIEEARRTERPPKSDAHAGADLQAVDAPVPAVTSAERADDPVVSAAETTDELSRTWESTLWSLVGEAHFPTAALLCEASETYLPVPNLQPEAFSLATLSPLVQTPNGQLVDDTREIVLSLVNGELYSPTAQAEASRALRLLVTLAAIRPALMAPNSQALLLIRAQSSAELPPTTAVLVDSVIRFAGRNLEVGPQQLMATLTGAERDARLKAIMRNAAEWALHARQKEPRYYATTNVWRDWLDPRGPLGFALDVVARNEVSGLEKLRELQSDWADTGLVERELRKTDAKLRNEKANVRPIEGKALEAIYHLVSEALHYVGGWIDWHDSAPTNRVASQVIVDKFRSSFLEMAPKVIEELERVSASSAQDQPVAATARAGKFFIEDLKALLTSVVGARHLPTGMRKDHLIRAGLLRLDSVQLDQNWAPRHGWTPALFRVLLAAARAPNPSWEHVLESKLEEEDILGASRVVEVARFENEAGADSMESRLADGLDSCRRSQLARLTEVDVLSQKAAICGLISETQAKFERDTLRERVESPELDRLSVLDAIKETRTRLSNKLSLEQQRIRVELERVLSNRSDRERQQTPLDANRTGTALADAEPRERITGLVEKGDLVTAWEFLHILDQGGELPALDAQRQVFPDFFSNFVDALNVALPDHRRAAQLVTTQTVVGPVDLTCAGEQEPSARHLLESWHKATNDRTIMADQRHRPRTGLSEPKSVTVAVREILGGLGFLVKDVQFKTRDGALRSEEYFVAKTEIVADRAQCPIPEFGSLARGKYGVLCIWGNDSENEILRRVTTYNPQDPVIVLYFGRLTARGRRGLAERMWSQATGREKRLVVVADDAVMLYCATCSGSRMRSFLGCTLPFAHTIPYTTTAGFVPDEMFFGRTSEIESIRNRTGTSLVYGGRQLGKTALLKHVERLYHEPARGSVVKYADLKVEGVRDANGVWPVIAQLLSSESIVAASAGHEAVRKKVTEWLGKDSDRSILLLLDEADTFFEVDRQIGSKQIAALKGLMESTDRRFKVVFAGLHNVQRVARDVNTPLAHFGQPLCIGPLFDNDEWKQAVALVEEPLKMLGFEFDSDNVTWRILSETNYYPSLVQVFCKHLLEDLTSPKSASITWETSPPYVIQSHHVDRAWYRTELSSEIRKRLEWTLDLDYRYRLAAQTIALAILEQSVPNGLSGGLEVSWVRDRLLYYWPVGFDDTGLDVFDALLEEMVGLGLLRKVGSRYTLRNANILGLLGTHDQIIERLLDASSRQPDLSFQASDEHQQLNELDVWNRGPLSEATLSRAVSTSSGISFVFGAPIGRIDVVGAQFSRSLRTMDVEVLKAAHNVRDFGRDIDAGLRTVRERTKVFIVTPESPWTSLWVDAASESLSRVKSQAHRIRFVFVGDAKTLWRFLPAVDSEHGDSVFGLRPMSRRAVDQLLRDHVAVNERQREELAKQIESGTGNWPRPFLDLGERCGSPPTKIDQGLKALSAPERLRDWEALLDIVPEALSVLRVFVELGEGSTSEIRAEDVVALGDAIELKTAEQVLHWGEVLHYIKRGKTGYSLDPFVRKLLSPAAT